VSGKKKRSGRKRLPGVARYRNGRIIAKAPRVPCACGRPKHAKSKSCMACGHARVSAVKFLAKGPRVPCACGRPKHARSKNCMACGHARVSAVEFLACPVCSLLFPRRAWKPNQTCSPACGRRLAANTRRLHLVETGRSRLRTFRCGTCGVVVTRAVGGHDAGICCSRACGFIYRDKKRAARKGLRLQHEHDAQERARSSRTCRHCGVPVGPRRSRCDHCANQQYLDRLRLQRIQRRSRRDLDLRTFICPVCGSSFMPADTGGRRRYCSPVCSKRGRKVQKMLPGAGSWVPPEWAALVATIREANVLVNKRGSEP
jgi:hypothetical protein